MKQAWKNPLFFVNALLLVFLMFLALHANADRLHLSGPVKQALAAVAAITGSGTSDKLAVFAAANQIGDSIIFDNGAGNIGIGTTGPGSLLHVRSGTSGTLPSLLAGNVLTVQRNVNTTDQARIAIVAGTGAEAVLDMGDSGAVNVGGIVYENQNDAMSFYVNNAERVRITNSGNIGIGTTQPEARLELKSGNDALLKLNRAGAANPTYLKVGADSVFVINNAIDALKVANNGDVTVAGKVKIIGGSPGAGKVLTSSDTTGLATWQTPVVSGGQWATDGNDIYSTNSGGVGIGTTKPVTFGSVSGKVLEIKDPNASMIRLKGLGVDGGIFAGSFGGIQQFSLGTYNGSPIALGINEIVKVKIVSAGHLAIGPDHPNYSAFASQYGSGPHLFVGGGVAIAGSGVPGNLALGILGGDLFLVAGDVHARGVKLTSDLRLKENIQPLTIDADKLQGVRGVTFDWRSPAGATGGTNKNRQVGFIAQEVEQAFPEIVEINSEGYKTISYNGLTAVLLEVIKKQQWEIEDLIQRLEALEAQQSK